MRPLGESAADFLTWNGGDADSQQELIDAFELHVAAVGDLGCGFEAPLEAWYRFLVDPVPPESIQIESDQSVAVGVDEVLLAQREAFLHPHGFVAIVLLTDEDDCSIMDGGRYYSNATFGYLISSTEIRGNDFFMPVATPTCETNPNAECCVSCLQRGKPPEACKAEVEATCGSSSEAAPVLSAQQDLVGLRCFAQKKRFGVDLLYPVHRYEQALTKREIVNARDGSLVYNPLMVRTDEDELPKARDPNRVLFMGVVGVPWQDIAMNALITEIGRRVDAAND